MVWTLGGYRENGGEKVGGETFLREREREREGSVVVGDMAFLLLLPPTPKHTCSPPPLPLSVGEPGRAGQTAVTHAATHALAP